MFEVRSTANTLPLDGSETKAVLPSGVIAMSVGRVPAGIAVPAVPVAMSTGVTPAAVST